MQNFLARTLLLLLASSSGNEKTALALAAVVNEQKHLGDGISIQSITTDDCFNCSGDPIVNLRLVSRKDRNKEYLLNLKIPTSDRNLDDLDEVETQAPGSEHGDLEGDPCRDDLEEDDEEDD
ncbi:unnamed protein product, partial [Amoebophrya sp. A120]|eukprot:GSA120T00021950001.1